MRAVARGWGKDPWWFISRSLDAYAEQYRKLLGGCRICGHSCRDLVVVSGPGSCLEAGRRRAQSGRGGGPMMSQRRNQTKTARNGAEGVTAAAWRSGIGTLPPSYGQYDQCPKSTEIV